MTSTATEPRVIYPPPEIRAIIDKTATYVAKHGNQFEEKIKENEKHNTKFSFLNSNDPYRAYYDFKVKDLRIGSQPSQKKEEQPQAPQVVPTEVKPIKIIPKEPPALEFILDTPQISAQDWDIMKLTALFVAKNGRQFLLNLSSKESKNYQFDFIKPNHFLFPYFTKLIDQYTRVLIPKNVQENLQRHLHDKFAILKRIHQGVEYHKYQQEAKIMAQQEAEEERIAFASIDWHDFVVAETIEFTQVDEKSDLPPPLNLRQIINMTQAQKKAASLFSQINLPGEETLAPISTPAALQEDVVMEQAISHALLPSETISGKKIKTDYVPKVGKLPSIAEPTSICPRCGVAIKVSEMEEHVRIELLDPKWREQRAIHEARIKETNLLVGSDISKNLSRLSDHRADIFGNESKGLRPTEARKIGPQIPGMSGIPLVPLPPPISTRPSIGMPPIPPLIGKPGLAIPIPPPPIGLVRPPPPPSNLESAINKKPRIDEPLTAEGLIPEASFLSKYSGPANITIKPSSGDAPLVLNGLPLTMTVSQLKEKIATEIGLSVGKQKLVTGSGLAMKNGVSLAYYNLVTGSVLTLMTKERSKK